MDGVSRGRASGGRGGVRAEWGHRCRGRGKTEAEPRGKGWNGVGPRVGLWAEGAEGGSGSGFGAPARAKAESSVLAGERS